MEVIFMYLIKIEKNVNVKLDFTSLYLKVSL